MEYLIPDGVSAAAVEGEILARLNCHPETVDPVETIYYDTFDWAVYGAGGLLWHRGGTLGWLSLRDGASLTQPLEEPPGMVGDLGPGDVRARIPAAADIRRLLPVVRIRTRTRMLRGADETANTVAHLAITSHRAEDPATGRTARLPARLRIQGAADHDDDLDRLVVLVEGRLGLEPAAMPLPLEALAALGRSPGGYASKPMIPLDPRARADAVVKQVLRELLDILEANVAGARANWDSEFLHDLRVATRRTRSVLTQLEDVFPRERIGGFRDGFAWLQQVTGPVRDLDVYLLAFDGYRASLPPSLGPKLEPLRAFLRTRHEAAHAELAAALDSGRFKDLVRDWRDVLEAPAASPSAAADAARPIKRVVDARIRRLAKRVRREGRAIQADSPPTQLHALRKRCKKLRYLMELFKSLYPDAAIKPIIKQLKVLLDQLGTFQDLAVQAEHLEDIAEQMYAAGEAAPGTLLAMGALVGSLLERQMRARDGFAEVFAAFDDPGQWARYRALFWASGSKRKGR